MKKHYTSIKVTVELYNLLTKLKEEMGLTSKSAVIEVMVKALDLGEKKHPPA